MNLFSSREQLEKIRDTLNLYARLPFGSVAIPGAIMEQTLASVRGGVVLPTYDFVDVVDPAKGIGWQVKATMADTPVTWIRAKIKGRNELIEASRRGETETQALGDAIIDYCNKHVLASFDLPVKSESRRKTGLPAVVRLDHIGFARIIVYNDGEVQYYERHLISRGANGLFDPSQFRWRWAAERKEGKKEQLTALHGFNVEDGSKWWAWHGRGENQLHFTGERSWWPREGDEHSLSFRFGGSRVSLEDLTKLLGSAEDVQTS